MSANDRLSVCINWCKANGGYIDERVEFQWTEKTGIMAVASQPFFTKDPLITIPKQLLVTNELAMRQLGLKSKIVCAQNPNALAQLFTAKLKFSNGCQSFHSPYIGVLPFKLEQPYFWSAEQLEILRGTDLYLMVKQNLKKMASEWVVLLDLLELIPDDLDFYNQLKSSETTDILSFFTQRNKINAETSWTSFSAYVWAANIFSSRAFPEIIINENVSDINEAFLYPVVDLLNHKNDAQVKWTFENDKVAFISHEKLKQGDEIFNSYGNKSNEELLLSYGFVQDNNAYDFTRLSLKIDGDMVNSASRFGIDLKNRIVTEDCIQFRLSNSEPLSDDLVKMFGYLCKLRSEKQLTVRSVLEGQNELHAILTKKVDFFRNVLKVAPSKFVQPAAIQTIKQYVNSERKIYHNSLEASQRLQKQIMKKNSSSLTSFKTIFKTDKEFANSLLIAFGIMKFEDLAEQNRMREALLLWIVRVSNKDLYPQKLSCSPPGYIYNCFQEVSESIVIEKEDVIEFMNFYKNLFPHLSEKIPETFNVGNWGIRQFIVADTVMDHLVWTREQTQEPYFVMKSTY